MSKVQEFWKEACHAIGLSEDQTFQVDTMGDSESLCNELITLIQEGKKTATCCTLAIYEAENLPIPKAEDLWIITDHHECPKLLVQTKKVHITPFKDVPESFARKEGEGDLSYQYWYEGHWAYFTRNSPKGVEFNADSLIVCEEFALLYSQN